MDDIPIEDRFLAIEDRADAQAMKLSGLRGQVTELKREMAWFKDVRKAVNDLSHHLQMEILKNNVLSEVSRMFPEAMPKLIRFMDHPHDWWAARKDFTIEEWATEPENPVPPESSQHCSLV